MVARPWPTHGLCGALGAQTRSSPCPAGRRPFSRRASPRIFGPSGHGTRSSSSSSCTRTTRASATRSTRSRCGTASCARRAASRLRITRSGRSTRPSTTARTCAARRSTSRSPGTSCPTSVRACTCAEARRPPRLSPRTSSRPVRHRQSDVSIFASWPLVHPGGVASADARAAIHAIGRLAQSAALDRQLAHTPRPAGPSPPCCPD